MNNQTQQPSYWAIANIGDVSPLEYGGKFVCIDRTGNYDPILWIFYPEASGDDGLFYTYHVELPRCFMVHGDSVNNIIGVGANFYHPYLTEWFGDKEKLTRVADSCGKTFDSLCDSLCSSNVIERAFAYDSLISYYGVHEFDDYSSRIDKAQVESACNAFLRQIKESKSWHVGFGC